MMDAADRFLMQTAVSVRDAGQRPRERQIRIERERPLMQLHRLVNALMQMGAHMAGDGEPARVGRIESDRASREFARARHGGGRILGPALAELKKMPACPPGVRGSIV